MKASNQFVEALKAELMEELIQTELPKILEAYIPKMINNITFNVPEAAEYLGISSDTLRTMYREKQIPHFWCRGKVRFRKVALDQWMEEQEKQNYPESA